jgi:ferredoxin
MAYNHNGARFIHGNQTHDSGGTINVFDNKMQSFNDGAQSGAASFSGTLAPGGTRFEAWGHQTLLQSMEHALIAWPSSCRNGTCRTCMGQLHSGAVRYAIEWPGLSAEEKVQGCVLPCSAYPLGDVVLSREISKTAV